MGNGWERRNGQAIALFLPVKSMEHGLTDEVSSKRPATIGCKVVSFSSINLKRNRPDTQYAYRRLA